MADVKSPGIDEKLTPVKAQAVSRRRLTAGPGFAPESLTVGFMMDRVTLTGTGFSPSSSAFPFNIFLRGSRYLYRPILPAG
jgi:hypothetical protein